MSDGIGKMIFSGHVDRPDGGFMGFDNEPLVLDLVEWVGKQPRSYQDVMAAWRTSCPRLQVWEDAVDHGLLMRYSSEADEAMVKVTTKGLELLRCSNRL